MSNVYPVIDGWVGFGDLGEVLLATSEPYDADDPRVKARPELFTSGDKPLSAMTDRQRKAEHARRGA